MIVLFLLPVALWPASALQQHQHGGATAARDGQFNPWVVSRPQGDGFYITYVQRTGSSSDVMFQLADSAGKLTSPVRVNDRAGDAAVRNENPPKVAVGPKGEVYVVWANEREKWKGNIRFARSTDEGRSFSPALTLNSDGSGQPAGHAFQSMVVDASSRIHVAWIDERNKTAKNRGAEIWICTSTDGGRTFRPDRKVLSDVCECCRTTFAADSGGNLFIAYRTVPAEGPMYRDIVVARSRDGGGDIPAVGCQPRRVGTERVSGRGSGDRHWRSGPVKCVLVHTRQGHGATAQRHVCRSRYFLQQPPATGRRTEKRKTRSCGGRREPHTTGRMGRDGQHFGREVGIAGSGSELRAAHGIAF